MFFLWDFLIFFPPPLRLIKKALSTPQRESMHLIYLFTSTFPPNIIDGGDVCALNNPLCEPEFNSKLPIEPRNPNSYPSSSTFQYFPHFWPLLYFHRAQVQVANQARHIPVFRPDPVVLLVPNCPKWIRLFVADVDVSPHFFCNEQKDWVPILTDDHGIPTIKLCGFTP